MSAELDREINCEYQRIIRLAFPEKAILVCRKYYRSTKGQAWFRNDMKSEYRLQYQKKWRSSKEGKAYMRRWGASESGKTSRRKYRTSMKGKATLNRWKKTPNGETAIKIGQYNHRAKRRNAKTDAAAKAVLKEIRSTAEMACTWCGALLEKSARTLDHIIPLVLNGSHTAENLTCACVSCNCSKSSKSLDRWLAEL